MSVYAPTSIDLSRLPFPDAIEGINQPAMLADFVSRFEDFWNLARIADPALPAYTVSMLASDPAIILARTWSFFRMLDRTRVNDAIRALLAPLAKGDDLDNLVARQNVIRLVVIPASGSTAAVMESDERLLLRYLLSFDRASCGSRDCYLYHAYTAWPAAGHIRVNGRAVHGRRGDVDIVVAGPAGVLPTTEQLAQVRAAVTAPHVQPETTSVSVLPATRREYVASLVIEIPSGPDGALIRAEAISRVRAAGDARTLIGGEVPAGLLPGAAYGPAIIKVRDLAPVVIEPAPYVEPVLTTISVAIEVRT